MGIAHYTCTATALVVCIVMLSIFKVESSSIFQLDIVSYSNPEGRDNSGGCCSGRHRTDESCQGNCSVYFRFCIKQYEANINLKGKCTFIEYITPSITLSNNSAAFEQSWDMLDSQDPYKMSFDLNFTWLGEFSLIVEAWHPTQVRGSGKVLISRFTAQRTLEVGLQWTPDTLMSEYSSMELKYRVICAEGYYGPQCRDFCRPRNDKFGHNKCGEDGRMICMSGWSGNYCDKAVCAAGCQNGTCSKPGECICRYGWEGKLCDQCIPYPGCKHGSCNKNPWGCICDEGWGGYLCDKDLNFCTNHKPCQNGGTCTNTGQGSYTCACSDEYMGENCNIPKNPCQEKPCLNNGICKSPSIGEYNCTCQLGFFGKKCETSASICSEGLCQNGGTCIQDPEGFVCSCLPGFIGDLCDKVETCDSSVCLNGGTCILSTNGIKCECPRGVQGNHCEISNVCNAIICQNGGTCLEMPGTAKCHCPSGYSGAQCQISQLKCPPNICANGGTCFIRAGDYHCECIADFAGKNCSLHRKVCSADSCLNGGTCYVTDNSFACRCPVGFKGNRCHLLENGFPNYWNENPSVASNVSHRISAKDEEKESSYFQTYLIIGGCGTSTGIIILCLCLFIGYKRRRCAPKTADEPRSKDCEFDVETGQNKRNAMYMNNKQCDKPHKNSNELNRGNLSVSNEAPPKVLNNEINIRIPERTCTGTLQPKIDNLSGGSTSYLSSQNCSPCHSKPIYTIEDHLRPYPDKGLFLNMGESLGTDV